MTDETNTSRTSEMRELATLSPLLLRFACISNTGCRRLHNEDNYLFFNKFLPQDHQSLERPLYHELRKGKWACVAIFDGMGGELAGEASSYTAAVCLKEALPQSMYGLEHLAHAFTLMQVAVSDLRVNWKLSSTGTTASILMSDGYTALIGNIGDSPIFMLRDGSLSTLSVAHTDEALVKELGLKRKPGLTQYLGVDESDAPIEPHLTQISIQPGDQILLASDGLTDMVDQETIAGVMSRGLTTKQLVSQLCDLALEAGGKDNITIVACKVLARNEAVSTGATL